MSAWVYAARRLMLAVPLLLGMSVLVFGLMRLVPGDPAVTVLGYKATPEAVRALREAFHLDEPLPRQYLAWLGGVARGDFGLDFRQNEPIGRMILDRLPVTIELTLLAAACTPRAGEPSVTMPATASALAVAPDFSGTIWAATGRRVQLGPSRWLRGHRPAAVSPS